MKTALFLGSGSDIAQELIPRFEAWDWNHTREEVTRQGWKCLGWKRCESVPREPWDALICCIGVLDPIGRFFDLEWREWEENVRSNVLLPLMLLREAWPYRKPGATVIFFSGAGVSRSAQTYSAYSASKIMLFKMAELLDDEEEDTKFCILGPGMVRTKIQEQTLRAKGRAMNWERVDQFMREGDGMHGTGTSHDRIYECVKWCIEQPKEVVGGRNIYVPLDKWGPDMAKALRANRAWFKLRRHADGVL